MNNKKFNSKNKLSIYLNRFCQKNKKNIYQINQKI